MAVFQIILLIMLAILLFFIFFKITKMVLKTVIITLLVFLLLFSVIAFTIFKDIKEGKMTENKVFQFFKGEIVSDEPQEQSSKKAQDKEKLNSESQEKT